MHAEIMPTEELLSSYTLHFSTLARAGSTGGSYHLFSIALG